ncbi:MAG: hypothetical protein FWH55_04825 [Oscillospiraceae bacterium]|nr:hypothetical protein [Oscillospiraceae bacterium]
MGLFNKPKKKNKNEINNTVLKENLGNAAMSTLAQGVDYDELSGLTIEFGYLFDIDGRGIEALFKAATDKGTFYFAVQKNSLMRINITEDMFVITTEQFLEAHG